MDYPLPVVCDDGDLPWSDHCSMDSDDEHDMILNQSPRWINSFSPSASASASASACSSAASLSASLTSTASHMSHAGQLSPISTSMDVTMLGDGNSCPPSASTAPAMIHSASSSSCADSWSIKFSDSEDFSSTGDNNSNNNDIHWEQGSDDVLTVPKLEPMDDDDDFRLDDVKEAPMTPVPSNSALTPVETKVKRPRGRPRKHPIAPPVNTNKVTKGRSKTGCITCRKRKKKCDEAKPRCMNCEKNAVVCEGYPEKQIWKSGRERAEEALMKAGTLPRVTMQPIFLGLETLEDHIFWKHYNDHLSAVLTVEGEHKNGFKMLVPIATKHQGLMHAILALAAAHLDLDTPYGINMLRKHPNTTIQALEQRSQFHRDQAMAVLIKGIGDCENDRDPDVSLSARYGQILCLLLENSVQGTQNGEHRVHLDAYQKLMASSPPQDPAFRVFITEFFQYRVFADELTRFPREHRPRLACETWTSPVLIEPPRLLGVADGLFSILSRITTIRNRIRDNMASQEDPIVDYNILCQAADIQEAIQAWSPPWPPGDSRNHVGPLYQQMIWMYLFRTIFPPSPSSTASAASSSASLVSNPVPVNHPLASSTSSSLPFSAVPAAAAATGGLPHGSNSISISNVHTPPKSASTSCSPSPHLRPNSAGNHDQRQHCALPPPHSPRRHSIAVPLSSTSMTSSSVILTTHTAASESGDSHHNDHHHHLNSTNNANHEHRAESPPPIRQPPLDNRITVAVEESLEILESFKPSDPAQTLLLIPCLVIGVTCFSPHQQRRVRNAVRHVRGYTGLKNTDRVMELLEEVWRLMNQGQWASVWDWQGVAEGMGIDFPCA